ncbi:MAG TPA: MlaD family protein [Burkholderiaceae bacterium]|jgi:paraquat-inducible protein B|nr:MlaD family protein [Burkholderiaceae bacterium]
MSVPSDRAGRVARPDPRLFRVGSFALVALALCIGVILALGGSRWFRRSAIIETYFDESVQGLDIGSKLKYRGVVLGHVTHIGFTYERYELDNPSASPKRYVLVEAAVRPERIGIRKTWDEEVRQKEIAKGLRIRLASQGLTGTNYLEMDYVDPAANPPLPISWEPEHFYVPSARSAVTQIVDAAEQTLNKVQRLDLEATVANLNRLLASLNRAVDAFDAAGLSNHANATLQHVEAIPFAQIGQQVSALVTELRDTNRALQQTLANPAWAGISRDLQATAAQARKLAEDPALPALLARADQVTRRIDRLVASRDNELGEAVDNLLELSENLRELSEVLKHDPSAVLFSRPAPALQR